MAVSGHIVSRHAAIVASVAFHGVALAVLLLKLTPPTLATSANAETPSIAVEVVSMPTPAPATVATAAPPEPPPPPPEPPPPEVVEEPPPLIESLVAEEVAPPPPPKVERKKERPPRPERARQRPRPEPVETREPPIEMPQSTAEPAKPSPAPIAQQAALAAPAGRAGPPPDYVALLHHALERKKDYPRAARQQRQQGRAMLRFAIDRGGNVLELPHREELGLRSLRS